MKSIKFLLAGFFILIFIVWGCKKSKEQLQDKTTPVSDETVKDIKLSVTYTVATDATVPPKLEDTVKKAKELLIKVFSSKDFRDELYKRNFSDSAYSTMKNPCFNKVYGGTIKGRSIAGKSVYDNLFPFNDLNFKVNIRKNGNNTTTMGSASICGSTIYTNDYWLKVSEKKLAYRLARHWAHEYTHIRGYRHSSDAIPAAYRWSSSDVDRDPAVGVGDVVGTVLDRWIAAKVITY